MTDLSKIKKASDAYEQHAKSEDAHFELLRGINDKLIETTISVHDKITLLAAGSASLLLTFAGVLLGSDRDVTSLEYKYIVLSVCCFTLTIASLLVNRYVRAVWHFRQAAGFRLNDMYKKEKAMLDLADLGWVMDTATEKLEGKKLTDFKAEWLKRSNDVKNEQIKNDKKTRYADWILKITEWSGYVLFVLGYVLAICFFIGVVRLLNS